jgi:hypothetical protein
MKLSACVLLLLVGCTDQDGPKYDVSTPSGPGAGTQTGGGGASARISGRVCVLADPQILDACSIKGAGGLNVAMGAATATTAPDGSFTLEPDATTNVATTPISVTGTGVVASQTSVRGSNIVPVMSNDLFNQMVLATGITTESNAGAILATVDTNAGLAASGVTASANPALAAGPFFDTTGGTSPWTLDATGARGVAFFPNVSTAGPTTLTFSDAATGGETTVGGVQVVDGGLTFVDAVLP